MQYKDKGILPDCIDPCRRHPTGESQIRQIYGIPLYFVFVMYYNIFIDICQGLFYRSLFDDNDYVKEGDLLLEIDPKDFENKDYYFYNYDVWDELQNNKTAESEDYLFRC